MQVLVLTVLVAIGIFFGRADAAVLNATWQFPNLNGLLVNSIDTVFLQWSSNYPTAVLQMWCQNGTTGNNVVLGSSFPVVSSRRFGYIISNEDPAQHDFPVACHAQLVPASNAAGVNSPFGITFTSQLNVAAQTFSLSPVAASSSTSATMTSTSISSIQNASSTTPAAGSSSTTLQTSSATTLVSSLPPSTTLANASGGPSSNNLGAIIGGALGGAFLVCFIVFGILISRRYPRLPKPDQGQHLYPDRSSHWWHREDDHTTPAQISSLHEIEANNSMRHEKEGDIAKRHEMDANGRAKSKRWTRFELPT